MDLPSLFDDPIAQDALGSIEKIRIRHHTHDHNTALQVLAWLSVQAGWKHLGDMEFTNKEGRSIQAEIEGSEDSAPLGLVELSSSRTTVRVSREKGSTHLLREINSGDYHVSSLSPADPEAPADLVGQQLARGGKNSLFLKILPAFLEFLE